MSERFRTGETAPTSGLYKVIDENGTVVRERVGLDDRQLYELKMEIEKRLPLMR